MKHLYRIFSVLPFMLLFIWQGCTSFDANQFKTEDHSFVGEGYTYFFPMVITPNGDHLNDYYCMITSSMLEDNVDTITHFKLIIKKNGSIKFKTEDYMFKWYGTGPTGNKINGMTDVEFSLGWNGNEPIKRNTRLFVYRGSCIPSSMSGVMFGDMIDSRFGAVYTTQETFCN